MKLRRDKFIVEYLKDHNAALAAIRAGCSAASGNAGYSMLNEPYVQQKLSKIFESMTEANIISSTHIVAGLIREANYQGVGASHGARVAAWNALAKIRGLEAPAKVDVNVNGGVMLVPMMAKSTEDWEITVAKEQAKLKDDVTK